MRLAALFSAFVCISKCVKCMLPLAMANGLGGPVGRRAAVAAGGAKANALFVRANLLAALGSAFYMHRNVNASRSASSAWPQVAGRRS